MTDHTKEDFHSTGNYLRPVHPLDTPIWGVVYEDGTVASPLTYNAAVAALTQPPNGKHAMITTAEAAEKFLDAQFVSKMISDSKNGSHR